mgnify:CR=1 FL=1
MATPQCDICGRFLSRNKNEEKFRDEDGKILVLCGSHNDAASEIKRGGETNINWLAFRMASAKMNLLASEQPSKRIEIETLDNMVAFYREFSTKPNIIESWTTRLAEAKEAKKK